MAQKPEYLQHDVTNGTPMDFSPKLLETVGSIAGIGGIALVSCLSLFKDIIRRKFFPTLTKEQAFKIIRYIIFAFTFITIAGITTYAYSIFVGRDHVDRSEKLLWESVKDSKSPINIQRYLNKYPDGFYSVGAQMRLDDIQEKERLREAEADESYWDNVKESNDERKLQAYLNSFPQGRFVKLAKIQLQDINKKKEEQKLEDQRKVQISLAEDKRKREKQLKKQKSIKIEELKKKLSKGISEYISKHSLLNETNWVSVKNSLKIYNKAFKELERAELQYRSKAITSWMEHLEKEKEKVLKDFGAFEKERNRAAKRIDALLDKGLTKEQITVSYQALLSIFNHSTEEMNALADEHSSLVDDIEEEKSKAQKNQEEYLPTLRKVRKELENKLDDLLKDIRAAADADFLAGKNLDAFSQVSKVQFVTTRLLKKIGLDNPSILYNGTLGLLSLRFVEVNYKGDKYEYLRVETFIKKTSFGDIVFAEMSYGFKSTRDKTELVGTGS